MPPRLTGVPHGLGIGASRWYHLSVAASKRKHPGPKGQPILRWMKEAIVTPGARVPPARLQAGRGDAPAGRPRPRVSRNTTDPRAIHPEAFVSVLEPRMKPLADLLCLRRLPT